MGGLLALRLARRHPRIVSALALMAPPFRLPRRDEILMRVWRRLPAFVRRSRFAVVKKRGGSDVSASDQCCRAPSAGLGEANETFADPEPWRIRGNPSGSGQ